jgi:hypothetical protein
MDAEHDSLEQVRRLLAVKKYERPPPRFFHEFSGKVLARLQALEAARPVTWWQRFGLDLDFRPALMGAFGVAACGLLLLGVISSLGVSNPPDANPQLAGVPSGIFAPPVENSAFSGSATLNPAVKPEEPASSTTPVGAFSPFSLPVLHARPAGYHLGE